MNSVMDSNKSSEQLLELYFLIQKCLSIGPLKETYKVLVTEIEKAGILPDRLDWEGNKHKRTLAELEKHYPHIGPDYLLKICQNVIGLKEKSLRDDSLLLSIGQQSLLRNKYLRKCSSKLLYYAARKNNMPLVDPYIDRPVHNIVNVIHGREMSGRSSRSLMVGSSRYLDLQLQRRTLGHLSAVYCLLFDCSGRYLITGADDLLIKLWSSISGRLLATFRGASSEITDIAINLENTLLAAGSIDRCLRVWSLQTSAPVAVLLGHTGSITSVNFCPGARWDVRYLISTSTDGSVSFWTYSHNSSGAAEFLSKPIQYQEKMRPGQAQMICSSFSPGGSFLATGSADHHVRVYFMHGDEGPHRILETQAHSDRVDSIQWSNNSLRFVSGSKDGTAHIWNFECQQWRSCQLFMNTKLTKSTDNEEDKKLKVTMVAWDCSDSWVITAVTDCSLKIWRADTGQLEKILTAHTEEIFVLESHPHDSHVFLSAGHDGQLYVWDILKSTHVAHFSNNIEGQGFGAIFDAKWSPDGTTIAATDSHGHILLFGLGVGHQLLKTLPLELFFHTDYRPLVRDSNHVVLDEQTQILPHLMPPPFLVDADGNPYPPMLQRLVPGREHCQNEQLVPTIVIGNGGNQEVIEGLPEDMERLPALYVRDQIPEDDQPANAARPARTPGFRRMGSIGLTQKGNFKWSKRALVQLLKQSDIDNAKEIIEFLSSSELAIYRREMRRRPVMINTAVTATPTISVHKGRRRKGRGTVVAATPATAYRTESIATDAEQEDSDDANSSAGSEDSDQHDELTSSDCTSESSESSGYSDWVADRGVNLEPPKRSKRRQTANSKSLVASAKFQKDQPKSTSAKSVPNLLKITKGELPELYKPPEWLSETMPCKAPYFPQMGDEIVYFIQGHQKYIDAVKAQSVYDINPKDLPWSKMTLKDHEFVKVVGIKYEIRPPRLCCLKLALLDGEGKLTDNIFTIKYHDMADVLDFLVLKQVFDAAISRNWKVGDRFRCMIDDCWWVGEITSKAPYSPDHPDSYFMSYEVRWDSGEFEQMSPWDMEPIREDRLPENTGEPVIVLPEEIYNILYHPQSEEWPEGDPIAASKKISEGLEQVMALAIAEPFLVPVDLSLYPTYAFIVEYPVDLSTIKSRLENNFYRRVTAVQFDVRYLATNTEKFNEPHSVIVKQARIISELCLRVIESCTQTIEVGVIYHQLMDSYQSSDSEESQPGPSTSRSLSLITRSLQNPEDWKHEARALIDALWNCEDSAPFRVPVDNLKHPDYYQVIDTPMDLSTIKEDLLAGNYETPNDFCKDMRLIFQNSKNYNTNKRSRIYAMTIRLSAMFEEHMGRILYNWKSAKRRSNSSSKRILKRSQRQVAKKPVFKETTESSEAEVDKPESPSPTTSSPIATTTNGHINESRLTENNQDKNSSSDSPSSSESEHSAYQPTGTRNADSSSTKRKIPYRRNGGRRKTETSENSESDDSDIPKRKVGRKKNNVRTRGSRRRLSSDSDDEVRTSTRRCVKRPKYAENSDSENGEVESEHSEDYSESEDSSTDVITTVSSRGRVRRLTPRAKALLRR